MPRHVPGIEASTDAARWRRKLAALTVDRQPRRRAHVAERFGTDAARDDRPDDAGTTARERSRRCSRSAGRRAATPASARRSSPATGSPAR